MGTISKSKDFKPKNLKITGSKIPIFHQTFITVVQHWVKNRYYPFTYIIVHCPKVVNIPIEHLKCAHSALSIKGTCSLSNNIPSEELVHS